MKEYKYIYGNMFFNWDDDKYDINIKKHGVDFEEAASAFDDLDAVMLADTEHSYGEERFNLIGYSAKENLLVVCHCERISMNNGDIDIIRIISARNADKKERKIYFEQGDYI